MGADTTITEIPELVFEKLQQNFANPQEWLKPLLTAEIKRLGPIAVQRMRSAVMPHYYTGSLSNSITDEYSDGGRTVSVYPTAQRGGRYDAGSILELGTKPIPNVPYGPIKAWAAFRGAPMPGAWLAIRLRGVQAHPFLDNTVANVEPDLDRSQEVILDQMIAHVLEGTAP